MPGPMPTIQQTLPGPMVPLGKGPGQGINHTEDWQVVAQNSKSQTLVGSPAPGAARGGTASGVRRPGKRPGPHPHSCDCTCGRWG